ncbi:hypothetical protein NIES4071_05550 [Calothrix sp. NIES-4071]|nr:hypothetical protein NIES4071_05550 [Calothrix sp. NIES-4071]BAZ54900.1 hypothetical protein NIES4105_05540 [Calothrix sp. NIES-4105]
MADQEYENLRVTQQAYIGTGGSSNAQLHVIRSDSAEATIFLEKPGADILKLSVSPNVAAVGTPVKLPLQFQAAGNYGIYIKENGYVGVAGITTPNFALDVKGTINTTEQYYKNGQPWKITGNDIAENTITNTNIKDGAITQAKLDFLIGGSQWDGNGNSISYSRGNVGIGTTSPNFNLDINGTINATQFYKNGQPWQVTREEISDNAINAAKIEDGSVGVAELGNGSVTDAKIANGNVTTPKIADANVTDVKLAKNAVTTEKIQDGNVTEKKLAANAVTTDKIKDGAITIYKLDPSIPIGGGGSSQWVNASAGNAIYYNGGNVGIGTDTPQAKLHILNGSIMPSVGNTENAGIMFPKDAFGGSGDAAWMRYYRRGESGEACTLEIGVSNDADDHIALMPRAGNVGIGTTTPQSLLVIRKDASGALGPVLTLHNASGGSGAGAAIDFNGYEVGQNSPTARIQSIDDGNFSSHLAFYTKKPGAGNNQIQERLRIQSSGDVGIGTTNPEAFLHVKSPDPTFGGNVKLFPTSGKGIDFSYDGGDDGIFAFTNYGKEDGDTRFQWQGLDNQVRGLLTITNRGRVDIFGSLFVQGQQVNGSSREIKENITDFQTQEAIETLAGLNPVKFNYRDDKEKELTIGFIAEDVPDLLATRDQKGVCPLEIIAVLTKVVQQQQEELSSLKERLNALEASV